MNTLSTNCKLIKGETPRILILTTRISKCSDSILIHKERKIYFWILTLTTQNTIYIQVEISS